jgi:hypothetical protein
MIHDVIKHAIQPDNDDDFVILGDGIDEPIHDAIGSANAKHSTEYRAI